MLAFLCMVILMQETADSNVLNFKRSASKEEEKRMIDFFDLLLQWQIEDERTQKKGNQKMQTSF